MPDSRKLDRSRRKHGHLGSQDSAGLIALTVS